MTERAVCIHWQPCLVLLIGLLGLSEVVAEAPSSLRVAVASNFTGTAKQLFTEFEQQHAANITISSGSSGAIYAQIVHGAPFDVFLSADVMRPELLDQQGLVVSGTRQPYAKGQLALWDNELNVNSPHIDFEEMKSLLDDKRRISIANPTTAPYGSAAKHLLDELGLWSSLLPYVIQGNSVLQAYQFIETGNVSRGLVAYHLVKNQNKVRLLPQEFYLPIEQHMVVLKTAKNTELAKELQRFLRSERVQKQLLALGYAKLDDDSGRN